MTLQPQSTSGKRPGRSSTGTTSSDTDIQRHTLDIGRVGYYMGSKDNVAIYLAGLIALISLAGAILVGVFSTEFAEKGDMVKGMIALTASALSFIAGASGRTK